MASITIDGREYNLNELSDSARAQLGSMHVTDQEINRLQGLMAITQTARIAYAKELKSKLPENESEEKEGKDILTVDGKSYRVEDFSERAKSELISIRKADAKIAELQAELSIAQTARNAYLAELKKLLNCTVQ